MSLSGAEAHFGGAFQFVPGEALAFDGALHRSEQHDRKQLTVGEALQPYLTQQPAVFSGFGLAALQGERDSGGDEINNQKGGKEHQEPLEAGRVGGIRMEMFLNEIPD